MKDAGKLGMIKVFRGMEITRNNQGCSPAVGIDLGITNSVAALYRCGRLQMVVDKNGSCIVPSCVYYPENGNPCHVRGFIAKVRIEVHPKSVIHDFLPLIGVKYSDPVVKHVQDSVGFTIVDDGDNNPVISVLTHGEEKRLYPEQVSSFILEHLKELTQSCCGFDITDAVISVPVWFSSLQQQLIRDAAIMAKLNAIDVVSEPVLAAYTYTDVLDTSEKERTVLVYNMGGVAFDASLVRIKGIDYEVLAYVCDLQLGGNDFDRLIRDYLIKKYKEEAEEEYGELSKRDIDRLLRKCEEAKIDLRVLLEWDIEINDDIDWYLSRWRMNSLISDKIDESIRLCDNAIARAGLAVNDIDAIVLAGGSSQLLIVEEKLRNHFPHLEIKHSIAPEECVAVGAAKYAYALSTGKYFVTPSHP